MFTNFYSVNVPIWPTSSYLMSLNTELGSIAQQKACGCKWELSTTHLMAMMDQRPPLPLAIGLNIRGLILCVDVLLPCGEISLGTLT